MPNTSRLSDRELLAKLAGKAKVSTYLERCARQEMNTGTCPSICRHCGAKGEEMEPDIEDGRCERCGQNQVASALVIGGCI